MDQTFFEIPLSPKPQAFTITLAGVELRMTFVWNAAAQCWMLTIGTLADGDILSSLPLVTGLDILAQYWATLALPGYLVVQTDNDPAAVPTFESLGSTGHLYFVTAATE